MFKCNSAELKYGGMHNHPQISRGAVISNFSPIRLNHKVTLKKKEDKKKKNKNPMGCHKSSAKKEVYSNTSLPQETRETSNKQPIL